MPESVQGLGCTTDTSGFIRVAMRACFPDQDPARGSALGAVSLMGAAMVVEVQIAELTMNPLETRLFGNILPSPLILASGPRSYAAEGIQAAYEAGAGAVVTKTLRLHPANNPTPHIVTPLRSRDLRNTLFNSEQWSDITWEEWVRKELPDLSGHPGALIASIGHTAEEAAAITKDVALTGVVDIIECVAYSGDALASMVRTVRENTELPILAKLTFGWGDRLMEIAEQALEAGANGFTAIDSIGPTLQIDIETGMPTHGGKGGRAWMSGAAIRPIAIALVADLVSRFQVPVVGTGGVFAASDVVEMTMVGASAVGACTAPMLKDLDWFRSTAHGVATWLADHGKSSLDEIRGVALTILADTDQQLELDFRFEPIQCTLCNQCVVVCAYDARALQGSNPKSIELEMEVDRERCRNCGLCVSVCRPNALTIANWP